MARDYDSELRALARLKADADDSISRRLDTGIKVLRALYGMIFVIVLIAVFVFTIRYDLNQERKDRDREHKEIAQALEKDRKALNQLYMKMFGVEVTFGSGN